MRRGFDAQLQELNTELIEMGALIEHAIQSSVEALVEQDAQKARRAIAFDREVDQKEKDIEALCLKLLLQQQPVARDLRLISAALKMITDMERIGDQSADISEIVIFLSGAPYIKPLDLLPKMADATMGMVTRSIDAFVRRDLEMAQGGDPGGRRGGRPVQRRAGGADRADPGGPCQWFPGPGFSDDRQVF